MNIGALFAAIPLIGVAVGLSRARFPRVPLIFAALVVVVYGLAAAGFGVWAATCWDCRFQGTLRSDFFIFVVGFLGGIMALTMLFGVWLGARVITMLQRLRVTWREIRGFRAAPGTDWMAAGLWRRFSAELIDIALFWLLLIVGWFIWFGFFSAREGQTPGKQILGLRVIRLDGTIATPGTMWLREVVIKGILWNLTGPLSYAAYIWAFFDRDWQTVHDKMVHTYVIYYPGLVDSLTPVPLGPGAAAEDTDAGQAQRIAGFPDA